MPDLYAPGVSGRVNKYFVCSERLRDRGWRGVGDWWLAPHSDPNGATEPITFADALRKTGIGQLYAWEVQRFIIVRSMGEIGRAARPKFESIKEAAKKAGEVFPKSKLAKALRGES